MNRGILLFVFVLIFGVSCEVWGHPSISVNLTVMEALPDDPKQPGYQRIPGMDRVQEPITIGIPIPGDSDTPEFELNRFVLLLEGEQKEPWAQFRLLKRWHNGRFRWLLLDALADLKANETDSRFRVYTGAARDLPGLGREDSEQIVVDTGVARFVVSKKRFNLFDQVSVGEVVLVRSGESPGIVLRGEDGTFYSSVYDTHVKVALEENGPVRAAIVAKGTHVSEKGMRNLDFTVRMHFYRGKKRVRVLYTLRNASKQQMAHVSFQSVSLQVKTTLQQGAFVVAHHDGETTGTLQSAQKVSVFQGENDTKSIRDPGFTKAVWPTGREGYIIQLDQTELQKGTRTQPIPMFYAQLVGQKAGQDKHSVMIGTRYAAGWWPQGLQLQADGVVSVNVFPEGNDKLYTVRYLSHTTREHVFSFDTAPDVKPRDQFFLFQYPLVARLKDSDVINKRNSLWEKIASFVQEWDYYKRNGWPFDDRPDATLNRYPELIFPRYLDGSLGGVFADYDPAKVALHNYLRQDNREKKQEIQSAGYFLLAEQRFSYLADQAIPHSDDFDMAKVSEEIPTLVSKDGKTLSLGSLPHVDKVPTPSDMLGGDYLHAYGMSAWYYLTGDERYREAYEAWAEYMQSPMQKLWNGKAKGVAWNLFMWADLFDFTEKKIYAELADQALQSLFLPVTKPGESSGTDWQRGFFVAQEHAKDTQRLLPTVVLGAILPNAYGHWMSLEQDPKKQVQWRSLLEGLVRFVVQEAWHRYGEKPGEYGYPPAISVDQVPPDNLHQQPNWGGGIQDVFLCFYFGYLLTGEKEFLDKGTQMLKAAAFNPAQTYWFQDLPSRQTLQVLIENKEEFQVWRPLPIRVEKSVERPGTYTLFWTVPDFTVELWIKYDTKTIVPWLGFHPNTRKYQYDPADYTAFFAAKDVSNNPKPLEAKKPQSFEITGLDPNQTYHFSVRYFSVDSSPPPAPPGEKEAQSEAVNSESSGNVDGGDRGDVVGEQYVETYATHCGGCQTASSWGWGGWMLWLWLWLWGWRRRKSA